MPTPALSPQNYYATSLASPMTASDTTVFVNLLPNGNEGFLEIDEGTASKEIIYFTSKGANFVTLPSVGAGRGVGGTSAVSHSNGAVVKQKLNAEWLKALQDGSAISKVPMQVASNPYKFSAYASVTTAITAGFVPTKITFGTKEYDTGGNFDAVTNNRFTAPIAGFYQFSAIYQSASGAANEFYVIYLYKNGSLFKTGTGHNSTVAGTVLESVSPPPFQLAANDFIEVYAAQNSAGTKNTVTGAANTYFGGELVSAT